MPTGIPSLSTSASASTGDASAGLSDSFQNNAPFSVTGSGSSRLDGSQSGSGGASASSNALIYVALGLGAVGLLAAVYFGVRR